jgi:hypothetical protein
MMMPALDRSHPAEANAPGSVRAPVPTMRLNTYTEPIWKKVRILNVFPDVQVLEDKKFIFKIWNQDNKSDSWVNIR